MGVTSDRCLLLLSGTKKTKKRLTPVSPPEGSIGGGPCGRLWCREAMPLHHPMERQAAQQQRLIRIVILLITNNKNAP
jgi:hypothetical protein